MRIRSGGVIILLTILAGALFYGALPSRKAMIGRRLVKFELKEASIDDTIIELAKSAKVNLIADATNFPDDKRLSGEVHGALWLVMNKLRHEYQLSWQIRGDGFILAWLLPDMSDLIARLKRGESIRRIGKSPGDKEIVSMLERYFNEVKFNPEQPGARAVFHLSNMPQKLREALIAYAQEKLTSAPRYVGHGYYVLKDAFWKEAKVWVDYSREGGKLYRWFRIGVKREDFMAVIAFAF